jgi:hypothetical protein
MSDTDATTWRCPKCQWTGLHTETAVTTAPPCGIVEKMVRACPKCFAPVVLAGPAGQDDADSVGEDESEEKDNLDEAIAAFESGNPLKAFFWALVDIASSLRGIEGFPAQFGDELARLGGEVMKGFLADKAKIMDGAFSFGMKQGFAGATAQPKPSDPPPDEKVGPLTPEEIEKLAGEMKK